MIPMAGSLPGASKGHTLAEPIGAWWREDLSSSWRPPVSEADAVAIVQEAREVEHKDAKLRSKAVRRGSPEKAHSLARKAGSFDDYTKALSMEPSNKNSGTLYQGRANISRDMMHKHPLGSSEWRACTVAALADLNSAVRNGSHAAHAGRGTIYSLLGFQEVRLVPRLVRPICTAHCIQAACQDVKAGAAGLKGGLKILQSDLAARLNYVLAVASFRQGELETSQAALEQAVKEDPHNTNLPAALRYVHGQATRMCGCCGGPPARRYLRTLDPGLGHDELASLSSSGGSGGGGAYGSDYDEGETSD